MKLPPQIKAEVYVNLLSSIEPEQEFSYIFEGDFRRNYQDDISKIENTGGGGLAGATSIYLNRDGIYDKLPEGLFHKIDRFLKLGQSGDKQSFKEEYEKQKNEIVFARKFFQPLDGDFFLKSVEIEKYFYQKNLNPFKTVREFFFGKESISQFNEDFSERIFSFLPAFNDYKGNIFKLQFFLSTICQAKVTITQTEGVKLNENKSSVFTNNLSTNRLGYNLFLGEHYIDHNIEWEIVFKVANDRLNYFIGNQSFISFFDFFQTFLIPIGVETQLKIVPESFIQVEFDKDKTVSCFLGINTII